MTLPEIGRRLAWLRNNPSVRMLASAWLGFKAAEVDVPKQYMTADDMRRLMQMTGGRLDGIETR